MPAIGCDCPVCVSPDPHDRRLRTSASLEFTDAGGQARIILLDAGPDLRQQALAASLTRCDAVLLTHNHVDHIFGLDELRRFNVLMRGPIDVLAEDRTLASVRRVYAHIFDRASNVQDSFVATLLPREIRPGEPLELFGLMVTPIRLLHGRLPVLGFRIDAADPGLDNHGVLPLAYCTDVSGIPPETWPALRGLNLLVLDALRHRHHPTHFTIDQSLDVADRVGAARTYFVHMSHDLPHAETNAGLPENIRLAHDGLVVE